MARATFWGTGTRWTAYVLGRDGTVQPWEVTTEFKLLSGLIICEDCYRALMRGEKVAIVNFLFSYRAGDGTWWTCRHVPTSPCQWARWALGAKPVNLWTSKVRGRVFGLCVARQRARGQRPPRPYIRERWVTGKTVKLVKMPPGGIYRLTLAGEVTPLAHFFPAFLSLPVMICPRCAARLVKTGRLILRYGPHAILPDSQSSAWVCVHLPISAREWVRAVLTGGRAEFDKEMAWQVTGELERKAGQLRLVAYVVKEGVGEADLRG